MYWWLQTQISILYSFFTLKCIGTSLQLQITKKVVLYLISRYLPQNVHQNRNNIEKFVNLKHTGQTVEPKKQKKLFHRVVKTQGKRTGTKDTIHTLSTRENLFSQSQLECRRHNSQKCLLLKLNLLVISVLVSIYTGTLRLLDLSCQKPIANRIISPAHL